MLPSIVYLGYPHSGSTTLARTMNAHPQLSYGRLKEHKFLCIMAPHVHFFYHHVEEIYGRDFKPPCGTKMTFDMTPTYFAMALNSSSQWRQRNGHRSTFCRKPKELGDFVNLLGPRLRFLMMLRNPVDMVKSMHGIEWFRENIEAARNLGCYVDVLEAWRKAVPGHEIKVVSTEDMFSETLDFFADLFQWIGVPNPPLEIYDLGNKGLGRRRFTEKQTKL
eukprot:954062-Amphidinium_carterae.1